MGQNKPTQTDSDRTNPKFLRTIVSVNWLPMESQFT